MDFKEKLQIVRKDRGLSQEAVAQTIGISRQAVVKWEAGQAYPDIENLVMLCDLLKVSIDRLVRPDKDACTTELTRKATFNDIRLAEFICKAKKNTYAARAEEEADSSRHKSHDIKYQEKDFLYLDSFLGSSEFAGEEVIWYQREPVWSMNYIGRVLADPFSGDFLKEALMKVPIESPYRGPMVYSSGDYHYHCTVSGKIYWFQGYEEIFYENKKVFECYFHGGQIK